MCAAEQRHVALGKLDGSPYANGVQAALHTPLHDGALGVVLSRWRRARAPSADAAASTPANIERAVRLAPMFAWAYRSCVARRTGTSLGTSCVPLPDNM